MLPQELPALPLVELSLCDSLPTVKFLTGRNPPKGPEVGMATASRSWSEEVARPPQGKLPIPLEEEMLLPKGTDAVPQ